MYNRWISTSCSAELYHYGVLGMKWGIRRFQKLNDSRATAKRITSSKEYKNIQKQNNDDVNKWASNESAAVDRRVSELEKTDKRVSDLKKSFTGDGSEYVWAVEKLTGDKKLRELDDAASEAYMKLDRKKVEAINKLFYEQGDAKAKAILSKTLTKSENKLRSIDAKQKKAQEKADKKYTKAKKHEASIWWDEGATVRGFKRAARAQKKADRLTAKGAKWYKSMEKYLGNNISDEARALGKQFVAQAAHNSKPKTQRR